MKGRGEFIASPMKFEYRCQVAKLAVERHIVLGVETPFCRIDVPVRIACGVGSPAEARAFRESLPELRSYPVCLGYFSNDLGAAPADSVTIGFVE